MENQTLSNVKYIQKINLYKIACSTYTANNAKSKKKGGSIKPRVNPPHSVEETKWGITYVGIYIYTVLVFFHDKDDDGLPGLHWFELTY